MLHNFKLPVVIFYLNKNHLIQDWVTISKYNGKSSRERGVIVYIKDNLFEKKKLFGLQGGEKGEGGRIN